MSKIYVYKMTVDDGGAPCVRDGLLTLAICKPAIRRSAEERDIIMAFAAKDVQGWRGRKNYRDNTLIYIAEIEKNLPDGKYYAGVQYRTRPDCIYHWQGGTLERRPGALFHDDAERKRDIGEHWAGYPNAHVLLSRKYRYFANCGPSPHHPDFPFLSNMVRLLSDGHRVNHSKSLLLEIERFIQSALFLKSAFDSTPAPKEHCKRACDQDRCYTAVKC